MSRKQFDLYDYIKKNKFNVKVRKETASHIQKPYNDIRKTNLNEVKIVNGRFDLKESMKDEERGLPTELKKHFLEIISTYNSFSEQMKRQSDIVEIAETLGGVVDAARELTINEADDWFDKVTIKRNMKELDKLDKDFDKFSEEAKRLDDRLHALYEDMGHILNRYYEISDIDASVMNQRLGRVDERNNVRYKHILKVRNNNTDEEFTVAAFPSQGDAQIALRAFKKIAPNHMEYYLTKK